MTNPCAKVLTDDHSINHPTRRVAQVRPQGGAPLPSDVVPLGLDALAAELGVSRMTAHRRMTAWASQQHDARCLRVVELPVRVGKGATRQALHVLWPRSPLPEAAAYQPCHAP